MSQDGQMLTKITKMTLNVLGWSNIDQNSQNALGKSNIDQIMSKPW